MAIVNAGDQIAEPMSAISAQQVNIGQPGQAEEESKEAIPSNEENADFLDSLLSFGDLEMSAEQMQQIKQGVLRVEQRAQISVKEHLQFGKKGTAQFKFSDTYYGGLKYIGEWSAQTDKPNGRGIAIFRNGDIRIGYYKDGARDAGRLY